MNTIWKNSLQEFCQKQKISLPTYRIKKQSGPPHMLRFQTEVEVNGHWFVGDDLCTSKKDAEQSAAKTALEALTTGNDSSSLLSTDVPSVNHLNTTISQSQPSSVNTDTRYHLPDEHADLERFIVDLIKDEGGRIRKIFPPDGNGRYTFEITGSYRYCEKVQRHHQKNQIYFIVDPRTRTYMQKCHDVDCYGFRSSIKNINTDLATTPVTQQQNYVSQCPSCQKRFTYKISQNCERCGENFCLKCVSECDYCHDALHCNRCIDSCFDCHDS